jgi:hypothetical protein
LNGNWRHNRDHYHHTLEKEKKKRRGLAKELLRSELENAYLLDHTE